MSLNNDNKIESLCFQFELSDENYALQIQSDLTHFVKNDAAFVLENTLEKINIGEKVVKLNSIEIDLGIVDKKHYKEEVLSRLKEKLFSFLTQKIYEIKYSPKIENQILNKNDNLFLIIKEYLIKGYFPWNTSVDSLSLDKVIIELINNKNEIVKNFVLTNATKEQVRKRIVWQLKEKTIIKILGLIEKENSEFIVNYVTAIEKVHNEGKLIERTIENINRIAWEIIFTYLLMERGSYFNKKSFLSFIIKQMAARFNISFYELLNTIFEAVPKVIQNKSITFEFLIILKELKSENKRILPVKQTNLKEIKNDAEHLSILRDILCLKNIPLDLINKFNLYWKKYIGVEKEKFKNLVVEYGTFKLTRENIINRFSEEKIHTLIKIIEPENSEFIIRYSETLETNAKSPKTEITDIVQFKKIKWNLILTYLLVDKGSIFNNKEFLKYTIKKLSAHYNVKYTELINLLIKTIKEGKKIRHNNLLILLLEELDKEIENEQTLRKKDNQKLKHYLELTNIKNNFRIYLFSGIKKDKIFDFRKMTKILSDEDKISMVIFKKEIARKKTLIEKIISVHNETSFYDIFSFFLTLEANENSESTDALINQIKSVKVTRYREKEFYLKIFTLILNNQIMNIQELIAEYSTVEKETKISEELQTNNIEISVEKSEIEIARMLNETVFNDKSSLKLVSSLLEQESLRNPELFRKIIPHLYYNTLYLIIDELLLFKPVKKYLLALLNVINVNIGKNKNNNDKYWQTVLICLPELNTKSHSEIFINLINKIASTFDIKFSVKNLEEIGRKETETIKFLENRIEKKYLIKNSFEKKEIEEQIIKSLINGKFYKGETVYNQLSVFEKTLTFSPEKYFDCISKNILNRNNLEFWVKNLPEKLLKRIICILDPSRYNEIISLSDTLWHILLETRYKEKHKIKKHNWIYLLTYCSEQISNVYDENKFIKKYLKTFLPLIKVREKFYSDFFKTAIHIFQIKPHKKSHIILNAVNELNINSDKEITKIEIKKNETVEKNNKSIEEEDFQCTNPVYINNAGLVLASVYIPRLFELMKLTNNNVFKNKKQNHKAVIALEYMVQGSDNYFETNLVLNKIMCGIKLNEFVNCDVELREEKKELIDGLIKGMITNWKTIGNTSVNGFRQSFLAREGRLLLQDDKWNLKVETKSYDMLLDSIPWSYSLIKHHWMETPIYIEWR